MQLTYTCTRKDFTEAQTTHSWRMMGAHGRHWRAIYTCLGVLFVFISIFRYRKWHVITATDCFLTVCGVYLALNIHLIAPLYYGYLYDRRHYGGAETSILAFQQEAIHFSTPGHSHGVLEWTAIKGFFESETTVLLYISPSTFLYLPKRILSPAQGQELVKLLRERDIALTYPRVAK